MGLCMVCCGCCFNSLLTKTLEIIAINFQAISVFFLLLSLIIIKWSNISSINLVLFILMFLISVAVLTLTIMIRFWRSKGVIKTTQKAKAVSFSTACFALIIICLVVCIIEEIAIIIGFYNADHICRNYDDGLNYYRNLDTKFIKAEIGNRFKRLLKINKNDIDCSYYGKNYDFKVVSNKEYLIAYITFSYIEFELILGIWLYYLLRRRIIQNQDGPLPISGPNVPRAMYDQYGRQVVVVQPGDVVVMGGQQNIAMPVQYGYINQNNVPYNNQYNNHYNNQYNYNIPNSQHISNQVSPGIPDSQEYKLDEKVH